MKTEQPMRVCFVSPKAYLYFNTKWSKITPGGAQRLTWILSTELAANPEFAVQFCVADYGQNPVEWYDKVKVIKSFKFENNPITKLIKLFNALIAANSDLYIFQSASGGIFPAVFYVKYFLRKKIMYMVTSAEESSFEKLSVMEGKFTAASMHFTFKTVHAIGVQTTDQATDFMNFRNIKVDFVLPNIYRFTIPETEILEKKGKYVLWVGKSFTWKQPEVVFEMAKSFPNIQFKMISAKSTDVAYHATLLNESKQCANLEFIEFVEPDKILKYYLEASIYIITSKSEGGIPYTLMEAMEAACAICSLNINPEGIFSDGTIGLYAETISQFKANLNHLWNRSDEATTMGIRARNYLIRKHDKTSVVNSLILQCKNTLAK